MFKKGKAEELKKLKQKAEEAFAKNDWKKSIEFYKQYVLGSPFDVRIVQRMGDLYKRLNQSAYALSEYKKVANYYAGEGYWAKAIAMTKVMLELAPDDREVQEQLAKMYSAQAPKKQEAIEIASGKEGYSSGIDMGQFGSEIDFDSKGNSSSEEVLELTQEEEMPQTQTLGKPVHQKIRVPLFSDMSSEEFLSVVQKLTIRRFPQSAFVCEEGDVGGSMFVISEGIAEVFTKDLDGTRLVLARLSGGQFFGEYSLITKKERNATVQAKTDLEVMEITTADLSAIAKSHPRIWSILEAYLKKRLVHTIMSKSPVFHVLQENEREELANLVQPKNFKSGEVIMKEETDGDEMFFIKTGTVAITSERGISKIAVNQLHAGDFFGEMAMLSGKKRSATVRAVTDVELFSLKRVDAAKVFRGNRDVLVLLQSKMKERSRETYETLESYKEAQNTLSLV